MEKATIHNSELIIHNSGAAAHPFPWMSETLDLGEEKNLFETRVTEYQSALIWAGIRGY